MTVFEHLKVRPFTRATSQWANSVVDAIQLTYDIAMDTRLSSLKYYDLQHLGYDIIPYPDATRLLGDPESAWLAIYGYYGYFKTDLFVAGRKVLKDGDPINIYDIFEPAKERLVQAIREGTAESRSILSSIYGTETQLDTKVEEIREKIVKIRMDQYGNVGVIIAEPIDEYGYVKVSSQRSIEDLFKPLSVRGEISASENMYGLELSLYTGGRPNINVYYRLGGAGTVYIEASIDGNRWRLLERIDLSQADEGVRVYQGIAYPFIRVRVPTTGIDVELEIACSR